MMNRREFGWLGVAAAMAAGEAAGQGGGTMLASGVFSAGKEHVAGTGRMSQALVTGMLSAGLRVEAHETVIEPGAPPEETRKHLHNEIWFVREGTVELWANGAAHTMKAGDMGLVIAGDMHYVKNAGSGRASYFVLAVGPPE